MAVSPYDLEQKHELEVDKLEDEIDDVLKTQSLTKGGIINIPTPKNFKSTHATDLFGRYISVGWSSVEHISDQRDGSYLKFIY